MPSRRESRREVALIFIEGDTEEEFYEKVFASYLGRLSKKIYNLHGNFNIHGKVFDKTYGYLSRNPESQVRVYCLVDSESRYHNPPLDIVTLRARFSVSTDFTGRVLSADAIFATPMVESWFFHDIEGIFKFLRVPRSRRRPNNYRTVERFTADDLSRLFERYGRVYIKGKRCHNFVAHLDIERIYADCAEFRRGIEKIIGNARR